MATILCVRRLAPTLCVSCFSTSPIVADQMPMEDVALQLSRFVPKVIVTLGERGVLLAAHGRTQHFPARAPSRVVNVRPHSCTKSKVITPPGDWSWRFV